ncbi:MarR family winged helix-turn-helix transcriptional regulator [Deinococcus roseus]|nr:MarR family transcriptional regulator [Deinococcus roseus]
MSGLTDQPTEQQLKELRQPSLGRLLLKANRVFSSKALALLKQKGYSNLNLAHTALLPHLDQQGNRLTVLTERMGLTKQSISQLVAELESQGYLERIPDPTDRRAVLVRFTASGWELCQLSSQVVQDTEKAFEQMLGQSDLTLLKGILEKLQE